MVLKQIDTKEWLYGNFTIQECQHPVLNGKYEVFKKRGKKIIHIGRFYTFKKAKNVCLNNK